MFLPTGNNVISVDISGNIVHFSLLKEKNGQPLGSGFVLNTPRVKRHSGNTTSGGIPNTQKAD